MPAFSDQAWFFLAQRVLFCSSVLGLSLALVLSLVWLPLQAKKRWEAEMKERGLSKDEAFMVETAQSAEVTLQQKKKKDKHKAAFGE